VVHGLQAKPRSVGVPLHELLTEIARMVDRFTDSKVSLEGVMPEAPSVLLAEGEAVASALILNEIISNAAKHAAVGAQQPVIRIQVAQEGEHVQVRVRNRGRLPDALDFASGRGLGTGLSLVRALVPAEGMRIAFTQDADIIEVTIDFFPPVVASNEASAALSEGRTPAYGNSGRAG
jgi:two-component sensor histidine kinase